MNTDERTQISKFLSYVLRHRPEEIGIELDPAGWVSVDVLLARAGDHGRQIAMEHLEEVVATNDKQRFEFSDDHAMIRARQGHSVPVQLGYAPVAPPARLYHGTAERNIESVRGQGLHKGQRHHMHLSEDTAMALKVGQRHGRAVLITIDAARMHAEGLLFYRTGNSVWLTDHVPAQYLTIADRGATTGA